MTENREGASLIDVSIRNLVIIEQNEMIAQLMQQIAELEIEL